ncbi:MAG: hypothetical protein AAFW46_08180 [Pseudomonadota bacterium]
MKNLFALAPSLLLAIGLSACQTSKTAQYQTAPRVELAQDTPVGGIDGNTIVLRDRGEALYFSSKLSTFLNVAERRDVFRRLIGREVLTEGAFLAERRRNGQVEQLSGIAAVTSKTDSGVALAVIRTFEGEDRIVDLYARPREMMAIAVVGVGRHVSCRATPWVSSKTASFTQADFQPARCELRRGRSFGG